MFPNRLALALLKATTGRQVGLVRVSSLPPNTDVGWIRRRRARMIGEIQTTEHSSSRIDGLRCKDHTISSRKICTRSDMIV